MLLLSLVCGILFSIAASADSFQLSVVPDKCISLRKGQSCFQRLQFFWNTQDPTATADMVCLWREGDDTALNCWLGKSEGKFRYNFSGKKTTAFYLVAGKQQQPVVSHTRVKIAWVYNNRSAGRTRWRLF